MEKGYGGYGGYESERKNGSFCAVNLPRICLWKRRRWDGGLRDVFNRMLPISEDIAVSLSQCTRHLYSIISIRT
jgi:hypothetical protein